MKRLLVFFIVGIAYLYADPNNIIVYYSKPDGMLQASSEASVIAQLDDGQSYEVLERVKWQEGDHDHPALQALKARVDEGGISFWDKKLAVLAGIMVVNVGSRREGLYRDDWVRVRLMPYAARLRGGSSIGVEAAILGPPGKSVQDVGFSPLDTDLELFTEMQDASALIPNTHRMIGSDSARDLFIRLSVGSGGSTS